ncbi:hypothetical protein Tco_0426023 [Tanacetum coccineum]
MECEGGDDDDGGTVVMGTGSGGDVGDGLKMMTMVVVTRTWWRGGNECEVDVDGGLAAVAGVWPEFSGGGWPEKVAAGRREGWPDSGGEGGEEEDESVSDELGDGSRVHTHDHDGSAAPNELPNSILSSLAVELSPTSYLEPRVDKYNLLRGGYSNSGISSLRSTNGGMDVVVVVVKVMVGRSDDGGKGGECACGAVHLARHSPAEGGDSEIGGDGDGWSSLEEVSQHLLWWKGYGSLGRDGTR